MSRFVNPAPQFWLNDGTIATSGKMVFFENGDYSTKKDTYANSGLTTANTNPVTLDGQGRMPACFGEGLYSVKFYAYDNAAVDNLGTLQWTRDDVSLSNGGAEFSDWSAVQTYSIGDATKDSGEYYILYGVATSKGERPSTTPDKWEQITFLTVWNSSKALSTGYETNETVVKDGLLYASLVDSNATTPPSASWANLTFNETFEKGSGSAVSDGVTFTWSAVNFSGNICVGVKMNGTVTSGSGSVTAIGMIPSQFRPSSEYVCVIGNGAGAPLPVTINPIGSVTLGSVAMSDVITNASTSAVY